MKPVENSRLNAASPALMADAENSNQADGYQIDGDNVVEQARHYKDQDPGR